MQLGLGECQDDKPMFRGGQPSQTLTYRMRDEGEDDGFEDEQQLEQQLEKASSMNFGEGKQAKMDCCSSGAAENKMDVSKEGPKNKFEEFMQHIPFPAATTQEDTKTGLPEDGLPPLDRIAMYEKYSCLQSDAKEREMLRLTVGGQRPQQADGKTKKMKVDGGKRKKSRKKKSEYIDDEAMEDNSEEVDMPTEEEALQFAQS